MKNWDWDRIVKVIAANIGMAVLGAMGLVVLAYLGEQAHGVIAAERREYSEGYGWDTYTIPIEGRVMQALALGWMWGWVVYGFGFAIGDKRRTDLESNRQWIKDLQRQLESKDRIIASLRERESKDE